MGKRYIITIFLVLYIFSSSLYSQGIIQNIINQVSVDSALYFNKELSGAVQTTIGGQLYTIQSRHKNSAGNDKAMQYIQQKLNSYGLTTSIQTFSSTGKNVYGIKTGSEFPNQKYIICAHYDDMPSGSIAPGADDNGSGTAGVIEAARVLQNYTFPYTVIFALWDEEEQGLVGSAYYAAQAETANDSILGVINMDMIAWDSNNDNIAQVHTKNVGSSLDLSNKMVELNQTYNIGLTTSVVNPGITASDHASFWSHNFGSILLIEDYGGDFNSYYHSVNDLWNYINIPYFSKCIKLSIATLASFALNLNMNIEHTPISSINSSGEIQLTAVISTGLTIGTGTAAPHLFYRVNSGGGYSQFYIVIGVPSIKENQSFTFTIPGQSIGSAVEYYIAAQDADGSIVATVPKGGSGFNPPGSIPPATFYRFFIAPANYLLSDSLNNMSLWTSAGGWGNTTSKYVSPPNSTTDSPSGNYPSNTTATLTYNASLDLSNILGAALSFDTQWDTETDWDYGMIQASTNNGTTWTPLEGMYTNPGTGSFQPSGQPLYDGLQTTWVKEIIDLSAYIGQQLKLRFFFKSDGSFQRDGWYIDNVLVTTYSAVPVELAAFNAEAASDKIVITWTTSSELNNRDFNIQRSADGEQWTSIGTIKGAGTTTAASSYRYEDNAPLMGVSYYRLKQNDYDGTYKIFNAVKIDLNKLLTYNLSQNYPNPFNPETTIKYSVPEQTHVALKLFDIAGSEISTLVNEVKPAGVYELRFNAGSLTSGVYFYRLTTEKYSTIRKMILIK
ncbi:MAG: M20/M25/M40 family metallo-hydrolase [Ignavibacteriaceae bacterium]|nr:M20/M25/M40 family metallo-hydrolase [Ignavibacteriaceae bacterium]